MIHINITFLIYKISIYNSLITNIKKINNLIREFIIKNDQIINIYFIEKYHERFFKIERTHLNNFYSIFGPHF